jgi:effector-binding domain-containing protein
MNEGKEEKQEEKVYKGASISILKRKEMCERREQYVPKSVPEGIVAPSMYHPNHPTPSNAIRQLQDRSLSG